jgi:sigma-E factor negative regulatory protein RseB
MASAARAETSGDALRWLERVGASADKLSYSGVFVYHSGARTETSRITHVRDGSHELDRLDVLDGSPRQVFREDGETRCVLPESRLVVVERHSTRRSFPAMLPAGLGALTDFYVIRKGAADRIAGYDAQLLELEPKDEFRYGRHFWVDQGSGLLLRSTLLGERGELRESFVFTELKIGGPINRDALRPRLKVAMPEWRIHDVKSREFDVEQGNWVFSKTLPGFRLVSARMRSPQPDAPEVEQVMFSDGLAAISVFIEPAASSKVKGESGVFSAGGVNVYRRTAGETQFMLVGDVPPAALKRLGDGIEARHR